MKKLRVAIEDLQVERFEVLPRGASGKGTVVGASPSRTWLYCETQGEDPTCRFGSCNTGEPCSYCP